MLNIKLDVRAWFFIRQITSVLLISATFISSVLLSMDVIKVDFGIEFTGGIKVVLSEEHYRNDSNLKGVVSKEKLLGTGLIELELKQQLTNEQLELIKDLPTIVSLFTVGPSFGKEISEQSSLALICSLITVFLYICLRYNSIMGLATIVAVLCDVVVTIVILHILNYEISTSIIGAILAIVGYSINDSVITLDKFRFFIRQKDDNYINSAIKIVIRRNVITGFSTLITVLPLALLCAGDVRAFSLTIVIGILLGMLSSLTVVPAIVNLSKNQNLINKKIKPNLNGDL